MRPLTLWMLAVLPAAGCFNFQQSVVNPVDHLGEQRRHTGLYEAPAGASFLAPFDLGFGPMRELALVDFEGDPTYRCIELQTFDAPDGSESSAVILYRTDDSADVYWSPNHATSEVEERRNTALLGRARFHPNTAIDYRLDVTGTGLDAAARLTDREGREVAFELRETASAPGLRGFLAPIGAGSTQPEYFPLFFAHDAEVVHVRDGQVRVTVGGVERTPAMLPWLWEGPRAYLARYSARTVISYWNSRQEAQLPAIAVAPGLPRVTDGNLTYELAWSEGHPEVHRVTARTPEHTVRFAFRPTLPDLAGLRDGASASGRFAVDVNEAQGIMAGEYSVQRRGATVSLEIHPLDAWQPPVVSGGPWVAAYRWKAELTPRGAEGAALRAKWSRAGK